MLHQFSRTELVVGREGLDRLRQSTVAVIGVGGVGSYTVEALARAGIGHIILVDKDVVDVTNINRQLPALMSTVGQPKVDIMAKRIQDINPECEVMTKRLFFLPETQDELFSHHIDYVADAIDTVSAKIHLVVSCKDRGIPIVSSMGAANKLDPTKFQVMDISETTIDPIARVMRRELRKHGIEHGLKVVCSSEQPMAPRPEVTEAIARVPEPGETLPRKATNPPASISFVPPIAGLILASIIIRDLVGV